MAKFKKGDRVRLVCGYAGMEAGSVGTVAEDNSACPWVSFDGHTGGNTVTGFPEGSCRAPEEWRLELIEPAAPTTLDPIAILVACGIITPAQADAARALAGVQ
jgi:hypothetical protein